MAAGLGFKDFVTGEVLTAADVDGYLMQGVWVFASAAARDAAVTSPQEGNFAYLKDTNVTTYYTGSAWANLDTTGMTNPMTTTGDTIYSSSGSTPARLGIGSTGQVLTVAGGVPSWATPGGGGFSLVKRASFSAVANTGTTFDDIFTSTYDSYMVVIENAWAATATDDLEFQLRYAGPTTMAVQYLGSTYKFNTSGTVSWIDNYDEAQFKLGDETGDSGFMGSGQLFFNQVGNASERASWRGQFLGGQNAVSYLCAGIQYNAETYTGLIFKSSSSNITGTISVYGMAKS